MVGFNLLGAGDPADVLGLALELILVSQICDELVARNKKRRGECLILRVTDSAGRQRYHPLIQ